MRSTARVLVSDILGVFAVDQFHHEREALWRFWPAWDLEETENWSTLE